MARYSCDVTVLDSDQQCTARPDGRAMPVQISTDCIDGNAVPLGAGLQGAWSRR